MDERGGSLQLAQNPFADASCEVVWPPIQQVLHEAADLVELGRAEQQIAEITAVSKSSDAVVEALRHLDEVYEALHPNERKELFRLVLRRIEVGDDQIVLEIYAGASAPEGGESAKRRTERLGWLPDEDSNLEPSD